MNHIPRSVIRNQMKALRREQARQVRAAAPGEKMMAALQPNRGYSWTTWTADRAKQVWHLKNWVGVCIDKLANLTAQLVPNVAYVRSSKGPGTQKRFKDGSRFDGDLKYLDCGGHSFIAGGYRRKALGVVKPHEEVEPVEYDHPLRRLIESPNDWDTQFDHDYELTMFQLLTGVAYDWAVPNPEFPKYPKELWCIPSHWVWPRTGTGEDVDPQHPFADRIVAYYEIRPWGGVGSWGPIRIPPDQIIRYTFKSPISKIDGWAKTQLMANWIDADDSIAKSQFAQMSNSAMPSFWLELGEGYEDPTDDQIDRIGSKFMGRYTGEYNMGKPFIGPPGTVPHPLSFPPLHMAYGESGDQSRDRIVSGFGLNLPILGLSENQTFGSVLANLMSVSVHTLKPSLTAKGQRQTKDLASKFEGNIRVYYDDPTPIDPDQLNKDIAQDFAVGAIVPNEVRDIRGRMPYEHGGDDPLVPGPGGLIPLPLATGYDLSGYAEMVPLMGRQDNPAAQEEEADAGLGSPQVDEPNGAPKKRWGGRLKTFNEQDHPRNESGEFGPKNGLPAGGSSSQSDASFLNYDDPGFDKHPLNAALQDAQGAMQTDSFADAGQTSKLVDACISTSLERNRAGLEHVPEEKRQFVEAWMNRQAKVLQKPADDLKGKVAEYNAAEQALREQEGKEPDDASFETMDEYNDAYDVWDGERDKLESAMEKLGDKCDTARERFNDKLDSFNFAFADKVMELVPVTKAAPEKTVKRRSVLKSALPSLNGSHK